MRFPLQLVLPILLCTAAAVSQTADRTAVPANPSTSAPAAQQGSYPALNGELVVAPGLRIPNGNVPWALDTVDGKQLLVPIHHAALQNPTLSSGTLPGEASHTPLHTSAPAFFVHSSDRTENAGDSGHGFPTGWALVTASPREGNRTIPRPRFSDVAAATVCTAPVVCTTAESLPDGWLRITPKSPLPPGEYALLPVQRNLSSNGGPLAYDFTVSDTQPKARDAVSPGENLDARRKHKH